MPEAEQEGAIRWNRPLPLSRSGLPLGEQHGAYCAGVESLELCVPALGVPA